jgi:MYXO-CTERM domain-containing protein
MRHLATAALLWGLALIPNAALAQNAAPTLNTPARITINVGDNVDLPISAADPDGDAVSFTADPLPTPTSSFDDRGDGSAVLSVNAEDGDDGEHIVTISASDGQGGVTRADIEIQILAVEQPVNNACAVAPAGAPLSPLLLLALLALLLRRRRAR